MAEQMYNVDPNYACREIVKDFSALGRKLQLTLNGDRAELEVLAVNIADDWDGYQLDSIPGLSAEQKALIPDGTIARTPQLKWDGKGQMADLIVIGEAGLQKGDSEVSDGGGGFQVPLNTTSRFVFEPNDVALAYGLPFRAGFKWDLTTVIDAVPTELSSVLVSLGYDPDTLTYLALIMIWENGSITGLQSGTIYDYLSTTDDGPKQYLERFLRGETSYRFFLPQVTVVRRYRTMPQLVSEDYTSSGAIGYLGEENGPPIWTNAPDVPHWGTEATGRYQYYATGPQIDFAGEFWVAEEQWAGFLDFDDELYGNPLVAE